MYKKKFQAVGAKVPSNCMPADHIDLAKWAVIACDQFTSEPDYWEDVESIVGSSPSALHIILPEIYLDSPEEHNRIQSIHKTMDQYLEDGTLVEQEESVHLVHRRPVHSGSRWGIMLALDLEQYDYSDGSKSLIRATEGTILERIPPRLRVRRNAKLELPHILVLIDDPEKQVIEPLTEKLGQWETVYDLTLIKGGGEITGYSVKDPEQLSQIGEGLTRLAENIQQSPDRGILFAVGDGNHSLATAKASWEELKQYHADDPDIMDHPARWALVEIENIHDPGLVFEPIHRVLFQCSKEEMESYFSSVCTSWDFIPCSTMEEMKTFISEGVKDGQVVGYTDSASLGCYRFFQPTQTIPVGTLQLALDAYLEANPSVRIDYIHGDDAALQLGSEPGNCGFFLPSIDKHSFFRTIELDGALPRKTFSMGEAEEKRYYLEARKITR